MASGSLPTDMLWLSVLVLTFSAFCWCLSALTVYMLWKSGERYSYVTLIATFVTVSTLASIIQQCHYAACWVVIKEAEYEKALSTVNKPEFEFGGSAETVDISLFFVQSYCYNVLALLILFWAISLFKRIWNLKLRWLTARASHLSAGSKLFAIFFPPLTIGLSHVSVVFDNQYAYFILVNINMGVSFTAGSVLLILILYKYMKTRRRATGNRRRSRWWIPISSLTRSHAQSRSADQTASGSLEDQENAPRNSNSIYDHALIIRFTIGFLVLAAYEVSTVGYEVFSIATAKGVSILPAPDLSRKGIISDLLFFIPGVTGSLVTFLIFGTTKSLRQYRAFLDPLWCCCCIAARRLRKHAGSDRATPRNFGDSTGSLNKDDLEHAAGRKTPGGAVSFNLPGQNLNAPLPAAARKAEPQRYVIQVKKVVSVESMRQELVDAAQEEVMVQAEVKERQGQAMQQGWEMKSLVEIK